MSKNHNLEIRERLAELYYESGFLDAAGKYWILTEPKDKRIKKCVEIYERSVNNSGNQILNEITFRGDKNKLPEYAKLKLTKLENDSKLKTNYIPNFLPKQSKSERKKLEYNETIKDKIIQTIIIVIMISIPILAIIGLITIIKWGLY